MASTAEALALADRYLQTGQFQAAEQLCRQVLQAEPRHPDALHVLGVLARQANQLDLAVQHLGEALAQQPHNAILHANLGIAFQHQGRMAEAAARYQEALRLHPAFPEVLSNLGFALRVLGRFEEAIACCQQAIQLRPDFAEAFNNLGNALADQQQLAPAVASFREALRFQPHFPDALNNLATALEALGEREEAMACYREATRQRPDFAEAYNNLGNALSTVGRLDEAMPCYREALRLKPDYPQAHSNLLFCMNYHPAIDAAALFAEHCRWDAVHGQTGGDGFETGPTLPPAAKNRDPERRLRVGYVSPDFRAHPVARFLEPILAHHDETRFETFCYVEVYVADAVTKRLQKLAHQWRPIFGLTHAAAANVIRQDGIDLLVDLAGHTADNRLKVFALKPAPVQITYLGFPNTTGLKAIDYRLTDAVADPPGEPELYSEQLVRLPGGFCCYRPRDGLPEPGPLPFDKAGRITFGAMHHLAKLNPSVLDLWSETLRVVPTSRLLIYRNTLQGEAQERLRRQFAERGIGDDRLDIRHATTHRWKHWSIYQEIDIALDPFPWSGHTTACEALWMGVPVVTLRGNRYAGRMVASVLTSLGLADWIAETPQQYVELAAAKAKDVDALRALRARSRESMRVSSLCDGQRFTRTLEDAYRTMWRTWCGA